MREIYTIGSSVRSIREFFDILRYYKIKILIDVRRFPTSKWAEHFKKENLELLSEKMNIKYLWFGEYLGGFRHQGYRNFMKTEVFRKGIREIIRIGREGRVALLCAEKFPWQCHRSLIGQRLTSMGWKVIHLIDKEKIWQAKGGERLKPRCERKNQDLKGKVFDLVSNIPKGRVTTYKILAQKLGISPRLVGRILNKNLKLGIIPCHRVVRSNGEVGGYSLGVKDKITLLKKEGIPIKGQRVVNLPNYHWVFKL